MLSVTFLFCRYGKVCSIANVCLLLNHLKSWEITAFMDFHLIFWNIKMYFESCEKIWQLFHRGIFISGIYLDRFNWNYSKQLSSMLSLQKIWFVKHQISITSIKRRQSYSTNYVQILYNFLWVFFKTTTTTKTIYLYIQTTLTRINNKSCFLHQGSMLYLYELCQFPLYLSTLDMHSATVNYIIHKYSWMDL